MLQGLIAPKALVDLVQNTAPWLLQLQTERADPTREFLAHLFGSELATGATAGKAAATDLAATALSPRAAETAAASPRVSTAPSPPAADTRAAAPPGSTAAPPPRSADESALVEYFTLCISAHHASVASFVPTDVDSKIRGLLWRRAQSEASVGAMLEATLRWRDWDVPLVSRRYIHVEGLGTHSGHDGERLSVLVGALGRALQLGFAEIAARAAAAIEAELAREAAAFHALAGAPGHEIELLCVAAFLTHNVGDVDQGLSYWPKSDSHREYAQRFGRLAHENTRPFDGAFQRAAALYRVALAPEGHRNYPLRGVKWLRRSHDYLLPTAPFLDDWGESIGRDARVTDGELAELLEALVTGARKLKGQRGYYRAIAGLIAGCGARLDAVAARMRASVRTEFRSSELRKLVSVPRVSFESSMKKLARAV